MRAKTVFLALAGLVLTLVVGTSSASAAEDAGTLELRVTGAQASQVGPHWFVVAPTGAAVNGRIERPDLNGQTLATDEGGRLVTELAPGDYLVAAIFPLAAQGNPAKLQNLEITTDQGPVTVQATVVSVEAGKITRAVFVRAANPTGGPKPPSSGAGVQGASDPDRYATVGYVGAGLALASLAVILISPVRRLNGTRHRRTVKD